MSCFCPSYVWRKVNKITGDVECKWIGRVDKSEESELLARDFGGSKTQFSETAENRFLRHDMIQVPCGKCIGCRMDYSRSWADRMTYHVIGREDRSWFITLTYNDDQLVDLPCTDKAVVSLDYSHLDDFIKRLRNAFRDDHVDFYASGEYGDSSFRPHWHLIVYNVDLPDLVFWKCNDQGDPIYFSEKLDEIWRRRGFVTVSRFSWRGAAYAASYVEKKRDGRALVEYTAVGLEPEKARMSRRPGLAFEYYQEHADELWDNNGLSVDRTVNKKGKLGLPRYFRKLACTKPYNGFDSFGRWMERSLDHSNVVMPFKVDNSSFDLDDVASMLRFEEKNFLSTAKNKKI